MSKQTFKIGQKEYIPKYASYMEKDVVDEISDKMGGFVRNINEEQFKTCERMIKDGWMLLNCYYGEKDRFNKNHSWLNARPNWFRFTGIDKAVPKEALNMGAVIDDEQIEEYVTDYVVYLNFVSNTIFLYDNTVETPSLSGTFHSYDDLLRTLKHIQRCIPAKQRTRFVLNREEGDTVRSPFGCTYYIVDFERLEEI